MKGQAHSFDFVFAVLVFLVLTVFLYSYYSTTFSSYSEGLSRRGMESHMAKTIENLVRTPGLPENWENLISSEYLTDENTGGLWHMNEDSGGVASDSSVNGNNGTIYNDGVASSGEWVDGQFENALNFSTPTPSQPDKIEVPATSGGSLDIHGSLTLEAWIRPTSVSGKQGIITRNFHSALFLDSGKTKFGVDGFSGFVSVASNTNIPTSEWTHVAGVYDSAQSKLRIYINGVLDNESSGSVSTWYTNSNPLVIGNSRYAVLGSDHCCPFSGVIDEARVSSTAREASELNVGNQLPIVIGLSQGNNNILDSSKVDAFFSLSYDSIKSMWGIGDHEFSLELSGQSMGFPPNNSVERISFFERVVYYNGTGQNIKVRVWK